MSSDIIQKIAQLFSPKHPPTSVKMNPVQLLCIRNLRKHMSRNKAFQELRQGEVKFLDPKHHEAEDRLLTV